MLEILLAVALGASQTSVPASEEGEGLYDSSQDASNLSLLAMPLYILPEGLEGYQTPAQDGGHSWQLLSYVGREDLILQQNPQAFTLPECPVLVRDGLAGVSAFTDDAQIIIVNEAHDQALHRIWVARLAQALSTDISIYAAETFDGEMLAGVNASENPDFIPIWLGSYSSEPMFGRALRTIRQSGYAFAAYEQRQDQRDPDATSMAQRIALREESQAVNFIAAVLDQDPDARVLVHVGYSHLVEQPFVMQGEESEWFAARLKSKTGIDPLTISQTHCGAPEEAQIDVISGALVNGAEVLRTQGYPEGVDLLIGRPPMALVNGRPQWRLELGDQFVQAPEAFTGLDERVIIEARAPGESAHSVPVERLMLYPGEDVPLLLPEGDWVLTAWTAEGRHGDPILVTVPPAP